MLWLMTWRCTTRHEMLDSSQESKTDMTKKEIPDGRPAVKISSAVTSAPGDPNKLIALASPLSPVLSDHCSSQSSLNSLSVQEKLRNIQEQLKLLLHAHQCQRRDQQQQLGAQSNGIVQHCNIPKCSSMKLILKHMTKCQEGRSCKVGSCAKLRKIIIHWRNCTEAECPICSPVRNASSLKRSHSGTAINTCGTNSGTAGSVMSNASQSSLNPLSVSDSMFSRLAGSVDSQTFGGGTNDDAVDAAAPSRSDMKRTYETLGIDPVSERLHPVPTLGHIGVTALPLPGAGDGSPVDGLGGDNGGVRGVKEWHKTVAQDLRNHLVHKLIQAIFPTPDPMMLKDQRISKLVQYARKVEGEMFDSATSKEEYYHLLAEKIYKIQRELDEKRKKRLELSAASGIMSPPDHTTFGPTMGGPRGPMARVPGPANNFNPGAAVLGPRGLGSQTTPPLSPSLDLVGFMPNDCDSVEDINNPSVYHPHMMTQPNSFNSGAMFRAGGPMGMSGGQMMMMSEDPSQYRVRGPRQPFAGPMMDPQTRALRRWVNRRRRRGAPYRSAASARQLHFIGGGGVGLMVGGGGGGSGVRRRQQRFPVNGVEPPT